MSVYVAKFAYLVNDHGNVSIYSFKLEVKLEELFGVV